MSESGWGNLMCLLFGRFSSRPPQSKPFHSCSPNCLNIQICQNLSCKKIKIKINNLSCINPCVFNINLVNFNKSLNCNYFLSSLSLAGIPGSMGPRNIAFGLELSASKYWRIRVVIKDLLSRQIQQVRQNKFLKRCSENVFVSRLSTFSL